MIVITTMDVLPDYCYDCPCHDGESGLCKADKNRRYTCEYRPYWCPLEEEITMPDMEKVIQGLKCCFISDDCTNECPYMKDRPFCSFELKMDTLEMMREQEAVEPKKQIEETEWIVCGNCNKHLIHKWKYCPYCGRSVKWE